MARQKGIIKLQGQIGGVSFYKSQEDGFLAREKGGVDADRIQNDPSFVRTRENMAEFGRAGAAVKLLRTSLRPLLIKMADSRMNSRLTAEMLKVIQADATNTRGQRNVIDGEAELLQGFEFNNNAKFYSTFFAPFTASIDRAAGALKVDVPAFTPANMIAAPQGATHGKLTAAGVEVDFETGIYVANMASTAEIVLGPQNEAAVALGNAVTPASTHPLFIAFGIEFFQQVNGVFYPLKNGFYNALALVKIDGGA
ncbi:MAG TPA: hypothetical protein VGQ59_09160 [Cyclobacteriaceae bacterium]|jgi:hypothetical protein|nr:hypothetical protein [Cyclobacteriaceae bacterium]